MATELARHVALPPIAMIAVCAATIGWRRLSPTTACLVALVALATFEHTGGSRGLQVGPVVGACDYYTLGQRIVERGRRGRAAVAVAAAIPVIATAPAFTPVVKVVGLFGFFCVIPCAGGVAVAGRRRHATTLAARVAELERRHRAQSEQAAAEERAGIARDMHDVIAHHITVMVIQAVAARRLAARDPAAAAQALDTIDSCGLEARREADLMMGLAAQPPPARTDLPSLINRARAAGLRVDLLIEGRPRSLPPDLDLTVYRVVQEALTNTLKHAGRARARVRLRYGAEVLQLDVTDTGDGPARRPLSAGAGQGLIGMRERVASSGGEVAVGKRRGGGFQVLARFPLGPAGVDNVA